MPYANLQIYRTTWRLITHVNLIKFTSHLRTLRKNWAGLKWTCKSLGPECIIEPQLKQLSQQIGAINETQRHIRELLVEKNILDKRAVLGFIGQISKILFGTLDEDDADKYDNWIETLGNRTSDTLTLVANQTQIVKSELEKTRLSHRLLADKVARINESLVRITNKVEDTIKAIQHNEILATLTATLGTQVTEYAEDTETLINAILFAKRGQLHPSILKAEKIIAAAKEINSHYKGIEFPISLESTHIEELLKLSDLTAYIHNNKVVFTLTVPMTELTIYEVYKHVTLPAKLGNSSAQWVAFIIPKQPYTAVSERVDKYFKLNDKELAHCMKGNRGIICRAIRPIHNVQGNTDCEVRMITDPRFNGSGVCDVRVKAMPSTYWERIEDSNSWLFSVGNEDEIHINCAGQETQSQIISGTGKLTLSSDCEVRSRSVTLTPFREITSTMGISFLERPTLDVLSLLQGAMAKISKENISDILGETLSSITPSQDMTDTNGIERDSSGLQFIIDKARTLPSQKETSGRLRRVECGLGYAGIGLGTFAVLAGIIWKCSLWSRFVGVCGGLFRFAGAERRGRTSRRRSIPELRERKRPKPPAPPLRVPRSAERQVEMRPVSTATTIEVLQPEVAIPQAGAMVAVPHQPRAPTTTHLVRATPEGWQFVEMPWGNYPPNSRQQVGGHLTGW